jgi:hypothetical protein
MSAEPRRRTDWALLLPSELSLPIDAVAVFGGDDEMARDLIAAGVARRCERGAHARNAELAVVWSDGGDRAAGVAEAAAAARVVVVEVDRRRRAQRWTTLNAIERRLGRAGCRVVSAHLVSPNFATPRRYIPIDDGAALRWHLRTLFVAASSTGRAARTALLVLSRVPGFRRLAGTLAPRLLVIGRQADDGTGRAGIVGSPAAVAGDRAIVLTSGYDAGSRSIVLPFAAGDAAPRHVVKVATGVESEEATAGEHERLRRLHETLPIGVARALPLPLRELSIAGREACVQSCAVGPSLQTLAGAWGRRPSVKAAELSRVVDWYNALARATHVRRHRHDWVEVFAAASTELLLDARTQDLLAAAESRAVRTGLAELAVHQHYDAGPWNIHLQRRTVGVVDWELDRHRPSDCLGPPLADVLYLVMYWYFLTRGITTPAAEDDAVTRLFLTRMAPDVHVVSARRGIDAALVALHLDRDCVPPALVALWAERAVYTARRQHALGRSPAGATRAIGLLTHLAARSDELFTPHGWWAFPLGTEFANDVPSRPVRSKPAGG